MIQIHKPLELVKSILPKVIIDNNKTYRKSIYTFELDITNGKLLYNSLTNELLFIDKDGDYKNELINRYFLVPEDFDEIKLAKEVLDILSVTERKEDHISSFTILPTTKCNARCFYCYEYGVNKIDMSKEIALDVVKFIKNNYKGHMVNIEWFGGEPLFNISIIDLITNELNKDKIKFTSSIITNGYLVDEDIVKKMKDSWHIKHCQITLDGTKDNYNRIKAYIYKDDNNPYLRVINNIKLLTSNSIHVSIRLNMNKDNFEDLKLLCDELYKDFKGNKYFSVYAASIGQYDSPIRFDEYHEEESNKDNYKTLLDKTDKLKSKNNRFLSDEYKYSYCKADIDHSVIVLPDGRLSLCEHFLEKEVAGDIYSGLDREIKKTWKKHVKDNNKECEKCVLYPICNLPIKCTAYRGGCTYEYKSNQLRLLKDKILNTYKKVNK